MLISPCICHMEGIKIRVTGIDIIAFNFLDPIND